MYPNDFVYNLAPETEKEVQELKEAVAYQLHEILSGSVGEYFWLTSIRPPEAVTHHAALAAAEVFVAYYRGFLEGKYRDDHE